MENKAIRIICINVAALLAFAIFGYCWRRLDIRKIGDMGFSSPCAIIDPRTTNLIYPHKPFLAMGMLCIDEKAWKLLAEKTERLSRMAKQLERTFDPKADDG